MPRPNAHPGRCWKCSAYVIAGDGFIERDPTDTKWQVFCSSCIGGKRSTSHSSTGAPHMNGHSTPSPPSENFLTRLIKIMGRSTSSNDNEALVALRMANTYIKDSGATWEDILKGRITIVADPFTSIPEAPSRDEPPPPPPFRQPPQPKAPPQSNPYTPPRPTRPPRPHPKAVWNVFADKWEVPPAPNATWNPLTFQWDVPPPPPTGPTRTSSSTRGKPRLDQL